MEVRDEVIGSNNTVMEVRNEAMEVRIRLWKYMNEVNEVQWGYGFKMEVMVLRIRIRKWE